MMLLFTDIFWIFSTQTWKFIGCEKSKETQAFSRFEIPSPERKKKECLKASQTFRVRFRNDKEAINDLSV